VFSTKTNVSDQSTAQHLMKIGWFCRRKQTFSIFAEQICGRNNSQTSRSHDTFHPVIKNGSWNHRILSFIWHLLKSQKWQHNP